MRYKTRGAADLISFVFLLMSVLNEHLNTFSTQCAVKIEDCLMSNNIPES